jgi:hypothetical protein
MKRREFFLQLSMLTVLCAFGLWFLYSVPWLAAHMNFSWACLIIFALLTVLMFFAARQASRSTNKNDFTTVALGFSGGKIFLSAILVLVYLKLGKPDTRFFVLPFLGIYVVYTVFEVYFMMRLGQQRPQS